MKPKIRSISGLTITELMAVVVIIGILAMLGWEAYKPTIARARRAEAIINLGTINDLQETYKLDEINGGAYDEETTGLGANGCVGTTDGQGTKNSLGFRPKDCGTARYHYTWDSSSTSTANSNNNSSSGKLIFPGCTEHDTLEGTYSNGNISVTRDVIERCD